MKHCKICNGKLTYATVQNPGRVSTYECKNCKRTVDIPFKTSPNYQPMKSVVPLALWYLKRVGSYKRALEGLKEAHQQLNPDLEINTDE